MRRLRAQISANDSVDRFAKLGAEIYLGDAKFAGRNEIEVDGRRLSFSKAIIATGPGQPRWNCRVLRKLVI